MSYHHLTLEERTRIEVLLEEGYSLSQIASRMGRHKSTLSREMKRCEVKYTATQALEHYQTNRSRVGRQGKATSGILREIEEKLQATWSPEQICATLFSESVCFKTVYRWLYQGKIGLSLNALRHKGKRQRPQEKRGTFQKGTSIKKRPKEVKNRETFGHWEADTVVSSRGKSKGCFATFLERKTRLYLAFPMKDRCAASMEEAILKLFQVFGPNGVKTITTDRGKEFGCYKSIEALTPIRMFFADPYSAWQRGSNENSNGLLREFFPKKTDLALVPLEELYDALFKINSRPRKCLGFKTSIQLVNEELLHLI